MEEQAKCGPGAVRGGSLGTEDVKKVELLRGFSTAKAGARSKEGRGSLEDSEAGLGERSPTDPWALGNASTMLKELPEILQHFRKVLQNKGGATGGLSQSPQGAPGVQSCCQGVQEGWELSEPLFIAVEQCHRSAPRG